MNTAVWRMATRAATRRLCIEHLLAPLGLSSDRVRLLRGDAADLEAECRNYDAAHRGLRRH